ncbi:MAG: cobalamin biosynthesis protein [Pseudomonadota bacterium]
MIVAGFGYRQQATVESLADALERAASGHAVSALAVAAPKAGGCVAALARRLAIPLHGVPVAALSAADTATPAPAVAEGRYGPGSPAEAAALVAAGPGAVLLAPRAVSTDGLATCAIAMGESE